MSSKRVGANDLAVAERIRTHRKALGLSQTELAEKLGLTFQQIQKYEHGTNRIGAGRLYELAGIFNVPVQSLYPASTRDGEPVREQNIDLQKVSAMVASTDGWRLCMAFLKIKDSKVRKSLIGLAEELASAETPAK
jgi:Predicted transcriptional regulators